MREEEKYKRSLDYPYLILDALRDVRSRRAAIGAVYSTVELALLHSAAVALYDILPSKIRNKLPEPEMDLDKIDSFVRSVIDYLHEIPGLLPTKRVVVGGEIDEP